MNLTLQIYNCSIKSANKIDNNIQAVLRKLNDIRLSEKRSTKVISLLINSFLNKEQLNYITLNLINKDKI